MAPRSDSLHSHQFVVQRVVAALAVRDPDPIASPVRRIGATLIAGVLVALLAAAAVGAYGALRPAPSDAWRAADALVVEAETGARFVYRGGVLHPVLNYSSALLILGAAPARAQVPRAGLVGIPRGAAVGIPGAPDLLPGPGELLTGGWTLCSRTSAAGVESVLSVGTPAVPPGGTRLGSDGLMVTDPSGGLHLLWNNRRFAVSGCRPGAGRARLAPAGRHPGRARVVERGAGGRGPGQRPGPGVRARFSGARATGGAGLRGQQHRRRP